MVFPELNQMGRPDRGAGLETVLTWDRISLRDMTEARPFAPVKYVAGIIFSDGRGLELAEDGLTNLLGPIDLRSPAVPFSFTGYYVPEMGEGLKRLFLSFERPGRPESLAELKLATNGLELEISRAVGRSSGRAVNLDPGYLTSAALIMATAKNFAHRVPLSSGIYAHLELLFTKHGPEALPWTYPDLRNRTAYGDFFIKARRMLLGVADKNGGAGD